ncbi:MAG: hypothetical protein OEW69_00240 [Nitrospirota bacterium]|nr:hypothetical protein [Nitrospirota bacterium]
MEHNVLINLSYIIALSVTFMLILMFPGISFEIWQRPLKKWTVFKTVRLQRKSRQAEEKLKKYIEIDMTKLR